MTAVNEKTIDIRGLSTETKPTHWPLNSDGTENTNNPLIGNGSTFLEMDTKKVYAFSSDNEEWYEL